MSSTETINSSTSAPPARSVTVGALVTVPAIIVSAIAPSLSLPYENGSSMELSGVSCPLQPVVKPRISSCLTPSALFSSSICSSVNSALPLPSP